MKYIKKYNESTDNSDEESLLKRFDEPVKKLYYKLCEVDELKDILTGRGLVNILRVVQHEMDEMDGELPKVYGTWYEETQRNYIDPNETPNDYPYSELYEAFGPTHARILWTLHYEQDSIILDTEEYHVREVNEEERAKWIEDCKKTLEMINNPHELIL